MNFEGTSIFYLEHLDPEEDNVGYAISEIPLRK